MITDTQWSQFVSVISDRFSREPEFNLHFDDVCRDFGFTSPCWREMMQRASQASLPFVLGGGRWAGAEPSLVFVSPRGTTNRDRIHSSIG